MKYLRKLIKPALISMLTLSSFIGFIGASVVFFGEYPYPQKPSEN